MGDFNGLANYYDLDYQDFTADLALYRNFAQRAGSSVLEIGCGTGRVLIPLAQANCKVTGVDISTTMLTIARAKAARMNVLRDVSLICADARRVAIDRSFDMAFAATNTFMLFTELPDQLAVLGTLHRMLRPGGLVIFDLFNPHPGQLGEANGALIHEYTKHLEERVLTISKFQISKVDVALQRLDTSYVYDEVDEGGHVHRTTLSFTMHYFWPRELQLLFERSGFSIEQVFGSYDLDEYSSESERMIVVATRGGAN